MNQFPSASQQRGAVLIVALIMLLLLTIIGLSSMRGTSLQENMAGNMRDSNLALQASEAAQRKGKDRACTLSYANIINGDSGEYEDFPQVSKDPKYAITYLDGDPGPELPVTDPDTYWIVINSTGYGAATSGSDPSSTSEIRSVYTITTRADIDEAIRCER